MDIGSLLGTLVLAALVMGVIVLMPIAIGRNLLRGHAYRERIDGELSGLRLSKMLGFLGIDRMNYLHKQQAVAIRDHMKKCDACGDKAQCDDVLGAEQAAPEVDLSFCANIDSLQAIGKSAK
jgi:hypothetical protein